MGVININYTALYRKFRPTKFSEIIGQENITKTLKNQIISNRIGHAYLFSGGRGTGKTSAAKVMSRAINCLNPIEGEPCNECEICKAALNGSLTDIVEMDAASNNSVEDIRSIRDEVNFLPTVSKYRVYIIDEVHMLSTGAFNALLKTLEEPPAHVKFILATTEPQKLPATILSRCQRFDFRRISNENIKKRLKYVCDESNIKITNEALNIISILAEGAMRDALSILERCLQDGENNIDENKIKELVGIPKLEYIENMLTAISDNNVDQVLQITETILNEGKDVNNVIWEIIKYVKDVLMYKSTKKLELYNEEELNKIKILSDKMSKERIMNIIYDLSRLENDIKFSSQKNIMFQVGIIKLCNQANGNLEERLEKVENIIKNKSLQSVDNNHIGMPKPQNMNISKKAPKETKTTPIKEEAKKTNSNLDEAWSRIVENLKQSGKIMLYTNLINTTVKEINDITLGIVFSNGMTAFGKTVLEKKENITEISRLVSIELGKEMQIKYISNKEDVEDVNENSIENMANAIDLPINIID